MDHRAVFAGSVNGAHPSARSVHSFAHPTGPEHKPRSNEPVAAGQATIDAPPGRPGLACAGPRGGHPKDLIGRDPPIGAAAGVPSQEPRLTAASEHPMQHQALSDDGEHDFAPSWQPRLESYPVSGSKRRPHRQTLRDEFQGARSEGSAQELYELGAGHPTRCGSRIYGAGGTHGTRVAGAGSHLARPAPPKANETTRSSLGKPSRTMGTRAASFAATSRLRSADTGS